MHDLLNTIRFTPAPDARPAGNPLEPVLRSFGELEQFPAPSSRPPLNPPPRRPRRTPPGGFKPAA